MEVNNTNYFNLHKVHKSLIGFGNSLEVRTSVSAECQWFLKSGTNREYKSKLFKQYSFLLSLTRSFTEYLVAITSDIQLESRSFFYPHLVIGKVLMQSRCHSLLLISKSSFYLRSATTSI